MYTPGGLPLRGYSPQEYLDQAYQQPGYYYTPQEVQQNYAPQGYAPQGYAPQGYASQGYASQGYAPQDVAAAGPSQRGAQGILKPSGSFERRVSAQDLKWDEQNIKETFHPKNKDYGFMLVNEPKTPYYYDTKTDPGGISAQALAEKIKSATSMEPSALTPAVMVTEDQRKAEEEARAEKHRLFEEKRKKHYHMERFAPEEQVAADDDDDDD